MSNAENALLLMPAELLGLVLADVLCIADKYNMKTLLVCDSASPGTNSEDDEPFDLMKLPYDIRHMVIKQLKLQSFIRLKKCSKSTLEMCDNCGFVPDLYINDVRFDNFQPHAILNGPLHLNVSMQIHKIPTSYKMILECLKVDFLSETVIALFRERDVSIELLEIDSGFKCRPIEFNAFLEDASVRELYVDSRDDSRDIVFYNQPAVRKLDSFRIWSGNRPLPDQTILALSAPRIFLRSLYPEVHRPFLDEWTRGLREIEEVKFHSNPLIFFRQLSPSMRFSSLFHRLFDDLEAEYRMAEFSLEQRCLVAYVTRADGACVRIDLEVDEFGRATVDFTMNENEEEGINLE